MPTACGRHVTSREMSCSTAAARADTGLQKGEHTRVKNVDAPGNRLTVQLRDGSERVYNPRRQQGVSIYREQERGFSTGDRV